MQRSWESEIGGSRPGTEMVGGDLSRPRPYMGCSAWVDGWMDRFFLPVSQRRCSTFQESLASGWRKPVPILLFDTTSNIIETQTLKAYCPIRRACIRWTFGHN